MYNKRLVTIPLATLSQCMSPTPLYKLKRMHTFPRLGRLIYYYERFQRQTVRGL